MRALHHQAGAQAVSQPLLRLGQRGAIAYIWGARADLPAWESAAAPRKAGLSSQKGRAVCRRPPCPSTRPKLAKLNC